MDFVRIGKGRLKIIVFHGWMSSSGRYLQLAEDLVVNYDCEVTLYNIPGFGGNKAIETEDNLIVAIVEQISKTINIHDYQVLIGHSFGSNLILRMIENSNKEFDGKIILTNPAYLGIDRLKHISLLWPFNTFVLKFLQRMLGFVAQFFVKVGALLTINDWGKIDDIIVEDALKADSKMAAKVIKEIANDRWQVSKPSLFKNVTIILGEKDRIIAYEKVKQLGEKLNCEIKIIPKIGHTPIVEAYLEYKEMIVQSIGLNDKKE